MATDDVAALRAELAATKAELAATRGLMDRIVAHAPIGIGFMDRGLVFRWANPALAGFLGFTPAQMIGTHVFTLLPEAAPQFGPVMDQVLTTGVPFTAEAAPFHYELDGEARTTYWDYTYAPIPGPDGEPEGILVVNIEVSARIRLLEAREAQVARLAELDRLRGDFLSAASHELRTPLTTVIGYAEFLAEGLGGPLNGAQADYVDQILRSTARLRRLVDDVLDVALMEAGEFHSAPKSGDLAVVVREAVDALRPQAAAAQVGVELAMPEGPTPVVVDAARIGQVVMNLLGNALGHAGSRVAIEMTVGAAGPRVVVTDDGPGLAPEAQARVFEKFWRGSRVGARTPRGAGLGLAIAKGLVEAHGGAIGVDSVPGEGAAFWFTLPAAR